MIDAIALAGMNIFQLRALSEAVNRRITAVGGAGAVPPMVPRSVARSAFKHGDLIEFTARSGATVRARVDRLNDKTIGCTDVVLKPGSNGKWRVSYGLARLVGADKVPPSGALPFTNLSHQMAPKVSAGAGSSAPGAGGW